MRYTLSWKAFAALKAGMFLAGIWMMVPVAMLRPCLAAMRFTLKVPNPRRKTASPASSVSMTPSPVAPAV